MRTPSETGKADMREIFVQLYAFVFAVYELVAGTRMGTGFSQDQPRPWDRRQVGQHVV